MYQSLSLLPATTQYPQYLPSYIDDSFSQYVNHTTKNTITLSYAY